MGTHLREPGVSLRLVESFSIFGNRTRGLPQPCVTQILKDVESGVAFIIIDTERRSPLARNNFERLKGAKKTRRNTDAVRRYRAKYPEKCRALSVEPFTFVIANVYSQNVIDCTYGKQQLVPFNAFTSWHKFAVIVYTRALRTIISHG